jgi:ArsR family metal-binding transcriptional regulator
MLIEQYEVKQVPGGCDDDPSSFSIQATLPDDISTLYPYVNAALPGCAYNPSGQVVRWNEGSHRIVLRASELAISNLGSWAEARDAMGRLVVWLNNLAGRQEELAERDEPHPQPAPLAIYQLLPKTNCRACGHPTCFTFALKLVAREVTLDDCPELSTPAWAEQRKRLEEALRATPRVVFPTDGEGDR